MSEGREGTHLEEADDGGLGTSYTREVGTEEAHVRSDIFVVDNLSVRAIALTERLSTTTMMTIINMIITTDLLIFY